jgi:hypothetical protein
MPGVVKSNSRERGSPAVPMTPEAETVGLCITCNNSPSCVYREARGKDALYCEMFDSGNGASSSVTITLTTVVKPDVQEKPSLKGLCVNCEHRDHCTLPRSEGGVWHCEEYE